MSLVFENALMPSEDSCPTTSTRLFYAPPYIFALTAGLLSPTAAIADTYDALWNNKDCQITINESGLEGPQGFIEKERSI